MNKIHIYVKGAENFKVKDLDPTKAELTKLAFNVL